MTITYGVYTKAKHERSVSGDGHLFESWDRLVLMSLVDGLGSGEEAAKAKDLALQCVKDHRELGLLEILQRCHNTLRSTRGVVIGLLRVDLAISQIRYAGVGNIGVRVVGKEPFHPISYNGIVGYRLPRVHEFVGSYHQGDTMVLCSDGIDSRFHSDEGLLRQAGPKEVAEAIARRYGRDDDICVLVAR